ncbi:hypothetical protein SO802_018622 [Lithocarpus litseifolius]|uniref:FAS1 domain-containing protein n=1 Tax=Lithocarpus litseifolius TaxID=425828 RepID=A0AAW2CQJ6_9ROSI
MTKQTVFSFSLVLIFLFRCTKTIAQTPDILKILDKPGEFTVYIRLLKSTGMSDQLNGEVQKSTSGYTVFAPNDKAFSDLRSGTINSLTDLQKVQLIQFHILATGVTLSNFQTLSNPVPTQAGGVGKGEFPLNVTSSGKQVQLATGVVKATLGKTLYSDDNLIVYQVDKVLLPLDIFSGYEPTVSAPAESPPVATKVNESSAVSLILNGMWLYIGIAVNIAAFSL